MKKIILIFSLLIPAAVVLSNDFVVKKSRKKKRISVGKLKQQCCDELTCLLKISPGVLTTVAHTQSLCFESVQAFLEDEPAGVFANKDKKELHKLLVQLKELNKKMQELQHELQKQITTLKA